MFHYVHKVRFDPIKHYIVSVITHPFSKTRSWETITGGRVRKWSSSHDGADIRFSHGCALLPSAWAVAQVLGGIRRLNFEL